MHLSLAFPGVDPGDTPGDLFSGSNKNLLNPWGMGQNNHTNFPSPGAKMKTKYLYLQKRQTNLSIFAAFSALTETFQYTHFSSCHAPDVAKGFIKGKALRLRTNSSKTLFEESINNFKSRLRDRGYPNNIVEKTLAEVKFTERKYALQEKLKVRKSYCLSQYNPLVPNHEKVLMSKWHIIEKQPLLREIFREPPIISYKRGRSLEDNILVRAKLYNITKPTGVVSGLSHF